MRRLPPQKISNEDIKNDLQKVIFLDTPIELQMFASKYFGTLYSLEFKQLLINIFSLSSLEYFFHGDTERYENNLRAIVESYVKTNLMDRELVDLSNNITMFYSDLSAVIKLLLTLLIETCYSIEIWQYDLVITDINDYKITITFYQ